MGAWLSKASPASSPGWSSLPPELADLVLRRLSSLADRVRFASVCRHWLHVAIRYSSPSLPRALPWLSFPDGTFRSLPDGERHSFRFRKNDLCAGSFGCWMLFEQAGRRPSRRHFLENPVLGTTKRLPGHCREPVDLNPDGSGNTRSGSRSTRFFISKVIVCSSDLIVAMVNYKDRHPCVVVCCRPGMSSWSTGLCNDHWYHDMAFYKGKLFTVTQEGNLFVHEVTEDSDNGELRVSRVEQVIQAPPPWKYTLDGSYATLICVRTCYLVISRAEKLLMVRWIVPLDYYSSKDSTKQMTLKVFEADFEMSQWLEVKSLDDQVLFVSSNSSKAISASSHRHCDYLRGNKIYFTDEDGFNISRVWPSNKPRTCGVYDMSSNTIHSISLGDLHISDQSKASWFFP
ncbi:probable F-box protein At1g44080 [Setaria viridis]|uniref:Uncharacterized protein n=1 Tax=Setaria viridis TaxID=4556 RepID=A0A4U6V2L0_SETVI|nr:uncharacterized protein LOC117853668 [Setaria viridis]TKW22612.1 hypothetical protein SEVIR_4G239900v2 [Setaria viridis]